MKLKFLIALFLFSANVAFAQDYMDEIANKACECLDKVSEDAKGDQLNMELGLCIIDAASPYEKQLKKDYKIDFDRIDESGEELGRIIGLKMATVCPAALMKMADSMTDEEDESMNSEDTVDGQITGIAEGKFVEFSIKDEMGKTSKYYWLTFIESNEDLSSDYKKLDNKNVRVTFTSQEFFDARIGEYRPFNIIQSLEVR